MEPPYYLLDRHKKARVATASGDPDIALTLKEYLFYSRKPWDTIDRVSGNVEKRSTPTTESGTALDNRTIYNESISSEAGETDCCSVPASRPDHDHGSRSVIVIMFSITKDLNLTQS